jgi:hypothetical protein
VTISGRGRSRGRDRSGSATAGSTVDAAASLLLVGHRHLSPSAACLRRCAIYLCPVPSSAAAASSAVRPVPRRRRRSDLHLQWNKTMPHSQLPSPVLSLSLRGLAGMEVSPHPASAYYWLAPAFDLSFSPFPSGFRVNPQSPSPYVIHDIQVQVYDKVTKKPPTCYKKR